MAHMCSTSVQPFAAASPAGADDKIRGPARAAVRIQSPTSCPLSYSCECAEYSTDGTYVQHINAAFASASSTLMELMTKREGLPELLRAFKSYFLLARGDLFTTFLELAEAELERNAADVTVTRLQSLLELGVPPSPYSTLQQQTVCQSSWERKEVQICIATSPT